MKPNTRVIIFSSAALLVLVCFVFFLSVSKRQTPSTIPSGPFPTSVPAPIPQHTLPLKVISVSPADKATGVAQDEPLIITFNQPVASDSVSFSFFPGINVSITSRLDSLIITPLQLYDQNIVYTYGLFDKNGKSLVSGSFTTGGTSNSIVPLTGRYPDLDTVSDAAQRQNYPDVFLSNYTPYDRGTFSIRSDFSNDPTGHYIFTVSISGSTGKDDFLSWLKQLGLTQDQIKKLEITYQ